MDYFYVGNHIGNVGLNDFFVNAMYKKGSFNTGLALHSFYANSNLLDPEKNKSPDKNLGMELDWTISLKIKAGATVKLGYSQLFGTESMEILKAGDRNETQNWVWAMVIFKPSFSIKTSNK